MTAAIYTRLRTKVTALLAKYGLTGTLTTYTESPDPAAGTNTRTPTNTTVKVSPFEGRSELDPSQLGRTEQAVCYIAAQGLAVTPTPTAQITIGIDTWEVVGVGTIPDDGAANAASVVAYRLEVVR